MKWKYSVLIGLLLLVLCPSVVAALSYADISVTAQPTAVPEVVTLNATGITSISGILNGNVTDAGGFGSVTVGFQWGNLTGNYTESWNTTGTVGAFGHEVAGFSPGTHVFYRAFVVNDLGADYGNETDFWTLFIPLAPTNFTITRTGTNDITINWTMGDGANTTVIRGSTDGYPETVTDGYLVYNSSGTSVNVTGLSLNLDRYYYRAWSWNSYGYSVDCAQAQIGGEGMLAMFLVVLALGVSGLFLWRRNIVFAIGASLSWLAIGLLQLLNPEMLGLPSLASPWAQILAYLFFIMAAGCLLWYISGIGKVKLTQTDTKTGKTWTEYGRLPTEQKPSKSQQVKSSHRDRIRGVIEKRR